MSHQIKKSRAWYWLNGMFRYAMMHTLTQRLPLYVVNEYPKSGGTWVGEMLSDVLDIPFPRNQFPLFRSSILHGHVMHSWNMQNVLLVWRDGRDVLVSQYYHWLFENDRGNARLVQRCRADLSFQDYNDIRSNLIYFMEYIFERQRHPKMSWAAFVARWAGCERCVHVQYEALRTQPVDTLRHLIKQLTGKNLEVSDARKIVGAHSFKVLSGRQPGQENTQSFMRKGIVGDWVNYFDQEAKERFHAYAGDALVKLGYEQDDAWVYQQHV